MTHQQRKAWSENMGHESEKITELHYGKLFESERFALFDEIDQDKQENETAPQKMTDAQKLALMNELLAKFGLQ
ncbi:hypothetical protein N4R57_17325 [Rhodobacteraceae bacterium D3-12]|nr:hypothetical protein N4R57_17325 [Rhodobacteraceae bacterium D3-12]